MDFKERKKDLLRLKQNDKEYFKNKDNLIKVIKELYDNDPNAHFTRNYFREMTGINDSDYSPIFGNFTGLKVASGIEMNKYSRQIKNKISTGVQHSKELLQMNEDKKNWGGIYKRDFNRRFQTVLCISDLHDVHCDEFVRNIFIEAVKRVQPEKVVLNGDIFEFAEFSKYAKSKTPNSKGVQFDIVSSVNWVRKFLEDIRISCPSTEIIFIEGNHDARIIKFLIEASPELVTVLKEFNGINNVVDLLNFKDLEINYVGKADLTVSSEVGMNKEISNNWIKVYDCLLFHHFPNAKEWGLAGVNGHHHKHTVDTKFNALTGKSYEWHQTGCGHKREADYCNAEIWSNGFIMCHVDTHLKHVQFEYVDCTNDFTILGGTLYTRDK